jgi:hypothetical protein
MSGSAMVDAARHIPLRDDPWDRDAAMAAIGEIIEDALAHFDEQKFWPSHPQEGGVVDGTSNLYYGAAGVIWALTYLAEVGATRKRGNFQPSRPHLVTRNRAELTEETYSKPASLLIGDLGILLLAMKLDPKSATADAIHARAIVNNDLPVRELMWGLPGSMLACIFMTQMTGEARWRSLFEMQAARLLSDLEETEDGPLWTQDLYGSKRRWLGSVHGYAGNMIPLLRGWEWLTPAQRDRVSDAVPRTLEANARRSDLGANWYGIVDSGPVPKLCQHCHGAPGMVTTFADAPFTTPELEALLLAGGEFTWRTGPLAKGSNLCHGTGGNGYAFLKLYRRTRNPHWLERAHAFAMTGIAQWREASARYGQGRYSLWTGDVGLAIYLWDCITADPRFPTVDVF